MSNVRAEMKGTKLIIEVDCSKEAIEKAPVSESGKSLNVATTHGFTRYGDVSLSMNVITPNPAYVKKAKAA